jgi:restriction endonuclease S subunit
MSFVLSKAVNPPTTFLAHFSELSDRFDPEMVLFRRKTHNFKYPVSRLREFFREPPQYGAGERGMDRETIDQPRYVRITDINEYGILNDVLGATAATIEPRYILEEDDLLLARSGNTVGKSYLHKTAHVSYQCFFAGYLIRFRFDTNRILPDYVFALTQLPYYKEWVQAVQRAAGQPNINAWEYSNLQIPMPPMRVQKKIIERLKMAYDTKRTKEQQAYNLLEKVDRLLLAELGITPKPAPQNTIENRIFKRLLSEVTGGRLDPFYYHPFFKQLEEELLSRPHTKIGDVALLSEVYWDQKSLFSETFPYIEISNVNMEMGQIGNPIEIPVAEAPSRARMLVRPGDLLVSLTRPTRRAIAFTPESIPLAVASNGFAVLRGILRTKVLPEFLFHVLRSCLCIPQFAQRSSGGSYPAITEEQLLKIIIPHPGIKHQEQIVRNLNKIQTDARELRRKASVELEEAKKAIETMILGEGD